MVSSCRPAVDAAPLRALSHPHLLPSSLPAHPSLRSLSFTPSSHPLFTPLSLRLRLDAPPRERREVERVEHLTSDGRGVEGVRGGVLGRTPRRIRGEGWRPRGRPAHTRKAPTRTPCPYQEGAQEDAMPGRGRRPRGRPAHMRRSRGWRTLDGCLPSPPPKITWRRRGEREQRGEEGPPRKTGQRRRRRGRTRYGSTHCTVCPMSASGLSSRPHACRRRGVSSNGVPRWSANEE